MWLNTNKQIVNPTTILSFCTDLMKLKKDILSKQLIGKISINIPPTFLDHMINELEEAIKVFNGQPSPLIGQTLLWNLDGSGHADTICSTLDPVEADPRKEAEHYKDRFTKLWLKANTEKGFYRALNQQDKITPTLEKLLSDSANLMAMFIQVAQEIRDMRMDNVVLGAIESLMLDHFIREGSYFLLKIGKRTEFDPIRTEQEMALLTA